MIRIIWSTLAGLEKPNYKLFLKQEDLKIFPRLVHQLSWFLFYLFRIQPAWVLAHRTSGHGKLLRFPKSRITTRPDCLTGLVFKPWILWNRTSQGMPYCGYRRQYKQFATSPYTSFVDAGFNHIHHKYSLRWKKKR